MGRTPAIQSLSWLRRLPMPRSSSRFAAAGAHAHQKAQRPGDRCRPSPGRTSPAGSPALDQLLNIGVEESRTPVELDDRQDTLLDKPIDRADGDSEHAGDLSPSKKLMSRVVRSSHEA
jgi:hypothetical protein